MALIVLEKILEIFFADGSILRDGNVSNIREQMEPVQHSSQLCVDSYLEISTGILIILILMGHIRKKVKNTLPKNNFVKYKISYIYLTVKTVKYLTKK